MEIKEENHPKTNLTSGMLTCSRCGYQWSPQSSENPPKACPNCKSYSYDQPYKRDLVKLAVLQTESQLKINRQLLTRLEALEKRVAQLTVPQGE